MSGPEVVVDQGGASPTSGPRPPLVRSTVYVFRALVGLFLLLFGMVLLLVFENALLGARDDIATIQEAWPDWLTLSVQIALGISFAVAVVGTNVFLLYRRKFRRWIMINAAAISADTSAAGTPMRMKQSDNTRNASSL